MKVALVLATENIYHVCWPEFRKLITIYMEMLDSEVTLLPPSSAVGPFSLAVKWLALHQKFMAMLYLGGAGGARSVALQNLKPFLYDAIFLSLVRCQISSSMSAATLQPFLPFLALFSMPGQLGRLQVPQPTVFMAQLGDPPLPF